MSDAALKVNKRPKDDSKNDDRATEEDQMALRYMMEYDQLPCNERELVAYGKKNNKKLTYQGSHETLKLFSNAVIAAYNKKDINIMHELNKIDKFKLNLKFDEKEVVQYIENLKKGAFVNINEKGENLAALNILCVKKYLSKGSDCNCVVSKNNNDDSKAAELMEDKSVASNDNPVVAKIIQGLLNLLVPLLNKKLPAIIEEKDLDPLKVDKGVHGSKKIHIFVCDLKASYSAKIKDISGLSSVEIDNITYQNGSISGSKVTANAKLHLHLNKNLEANGNGKASAKCGHLHPSVHIGVSGKASGVTVSSNVSLEATVDVSKLKGTLNAAHFSGLKLNYSRADVDIHGLGIFGDLLGAIVDKLSPLFKEIILDEATPPLQRLLNDEMQDLLPIST